MRAFKKKELHEEDRSTYAEVIESAIAVVFAKMVDVISKKKGTNKKNI